MSVRERFWRSPQHSPRPRRRARGCDDARAIFIGSTWRVARRVTDIGAWRAPHGVLGRHMLREQASQGWTNLWLSGERFVEERGHPHRRWQDANLEPSGYQTPDLRCSGEVSASGRPNSNSVARVAHVPHQEDRPSALQGHPTAPPPSPSSLDRAFLPVCPSTRRLWPPPCSLRSGWGLGKEGYALETVTARICREAGGRVTTNVWFATLTSPRAGWRSLLTGCRSSGEPARHHNHREHTPRERCSTEIPRRRCSVGGRSAGEGEALSGACRSSGARSLGGAGRGGLWPLVFGDQVIPELPGQGQGAFRVASDAEARRAGLATSLGFPVFLYSSTLRDDVFA